MSTIQLSHAERELALRNGFFDNLSTAFGGNKSADSAPLIDFSAKPVLQSGAKGAAVTDLQETVNRAAAIVNSTPATVDGVFGPNTAAAVKSFQKSRGIAQSGVADTNTWAHLAQVFNDYNDAIAKSAKSAKQAQTAATVGQVGSGVVATLSQLFGPQLPVTSAEAAPAAAVPATSGTNWVMVVGVSAVSLAAVGGAVWYFTRDKA